MESQGLFDAVRLFCLGELLLRGVWLCSLRLCSSVVVLLVFLFAAALMLSVLLLCVFCCMHQFVFWLCCSCSLGLWCVTFVCFLVPTLVGARDIRFFFFLSSFNFSVLPLL